MTSALISEGGSNMRRLSIAFVAVLGLAVSLPLMIHPAVDTVAATGEFRQNSNVIDQLPVNFKQLPVQSFDAF